MKDDRLYLYHILERCRRIDRFIQPGRDAFMASDVIQDAVVRNLEVIGEAAKHVSSATRERIPTVSWRAVCGMRDVLIHGYIGVDLDEVWSVASTRIPELAQAVEAFLGPSSTSGPQP